MAKKRNKKFEILQLDTLTPEEIDLVVDSLNTLKQSRGWKIIKQTLDLNIKETERKILEESASWDREDFEIWKFIRIYQQDLSNIPDLIINSFKPEKEIEIENPDPWDDKKKVKNLTF